MTTPPAQSASPNLRLLLPAARTADQIAHTAQPPVLADAPAGPAPWHTSSAAVDARPYSSFADAAASVLTYLQTHLNLGLWAVTRVADNDWILLSHRGEVYPLPDQPVLAWSDSICARMTAGHGPAITPDISTVPAYVDAPISQLMPIGTYIGIPLHGPDGQLYGTLCGIDPATSDDSLHNAKPMLDLLARLLSTVLIGEIHADRHARRAEQAEHAARRDALTGLLNRSGWDAGLLAEQRRYDRHLHPTSILVVDLDGLKHANDTEGHSAGDEALCRCAAVLATHTREHDLVARTGGDEFAILAPDTTDEQARALVARLQIALEGAGVPASVGHATVDPRQPQLEQTWNRADASMYIDKTLRRRLRHRQG